MRLLELTLFDDYKTLKKNKTFKFKNNNILCIAGKNGSGKTNLFEVLSSILTVAALNHKFETNFKYKLKLELKGSEIYITNKNNVTKIYKMINGEEIELGKEYLKNNLNVVIYSSAKRSVLSEAHYFEILEKIKSKEESTDCYNYFVREKIKKCIILYLLLFDFNELKSILKEFISIKEIEEIILEIKTEFKDVLNKEQRKITKEIIIKKTYKEINEGVKVKLNKTDIEKIKEFYKDNKFHFFSLLESLEKLNFIDSLKKIDTYEDLFSEILSERVEDNYLSDKFFISKIYLQGEIGVHSLSEGELQLIETIGTILLFQNKEFQKENLYIFDEPGTHLNVNWMSKYITLLKKIMSIKSIEESKLESQLIFSTHNTEIISDLPVDNLHLIEKGQFKPIQEETFGSSEFKLNKILFDKISSVSDNVLNKISEYYEKIEEINTREELEKMEECVEVTFGTSPEKYKLLKYIQDKLFKMEICE